jgi:signal transduction histidine kinase
MTVLIIEDDPDGRELLSLILKDGGFDPISAGGGMEGLSMLRNHHETIEVVLLDLMMPEVDGYKVLIDMMKDENLREIPVIVVSALEDPKSIQKAFELGAFDYVTKPIEALSLIARAKASIRFSEAKVQLKEKNKVLTELNKETEAQRKRLEENLAYMDDLIDVMDHKIKNKLVPITTYSETFMDLVADKDEATAFKNIYISSVQLNEVIEDLLADMKLKMKSTENQKQEMDLRSLIRGLIQKNMAILKEHGLAVDMDISERVPERLVTDITLFYNILDNLLSNSIKYTDPGGMIMVTGDMRDESTLSLVVEDTGIGIDTQHIEKIFNKDYIVPLQDYAKKFNRTGKGLYLVQKFVSALGGNIRVESEKGKGTRFIIEIDASPQLVSNVV